MTVQQKSRFCPDCRVRTLHCRQMPSDGLCLLLTILTGGGFILIWIIMASFATARGYRCQRCGRKN